MTPRIQSSDPVRRPDYWYLAVPAATMVFAGTFAIAAVRAPFGPVPYYFLPFWLGVIAAPGYLMAWLMLRGKRALTEAQRRFAVASVYLALGCCAAGAVFAAFTIVGGVLSLWSGVLAFLLLRKMRRST